MMTLAKLKKGMVVCEAKDFFALWENNYGEILIRKKLTT